MRPDHHPPPVAPLLGAGVAQLLGAALAPSELQVLSARPSQVRYDPGRRLVVRYATQVRDRAGRERTETMVAVADSKGPPVGTAVLADGQGGLVGVWRYPNDPFLPGLRSMVYAQGARAVLAQVGIDVGAPRIQPVVYRPGRRAVLRITLPGGALYAKLVRPHRAERTFETYRAMAGHAPVPRALGLSAEHGLVLLEAMPGDPLASRLSLPRAVVPPPKALLGLLDAIAGVDVGDVPPVQPAEVAAMHARMLLAVVPGERALVEEIAGQVAEAPPAPAPTRTVHGDFYEGQVLVRGHEVSGLLDVDGARPGTGVEDLATLLAHLHGLALVRPAAAGRIDSYRRTVERLALRRVSPEALRPAVAGVLLGLATGPFRMQEPGWPARTTAWLRLASEVHQGPADGREKVLTSASSGVHASRSS